ncbi:uncharacterized protein N7483_007143 [Penicillium malachiteum]|uniref:uncharacterized protein n=1 Tax=Penicillium malachiteum TaxID=1324776 RepID=UPI002548F815|nr:uncharacterized protein N7483_007143 [Penicillium malachiteum]KAJ5725786.1 hypothetical protein N7483_007143 [Penicillium malachiteum]
MSSEKLGPKIFGPPLFVKPKKTAVTVSDDFNQSQRAVSNTFNESQAAVPKAQVRTVGPAPWPGFKALNSNVPGPAVKKTGSEPDPFKKLYPPSNISQDSKPSTPVSKMPRVIGPQPYQGPRK